MSYTRHNISSFSPSGSFIFTDLEAEEGKLSPASFCAYTRNSYCRPSIKLEMFICVVIQIEKLILVQASLPFVFVYPVALDPRASVIHRFFPTEIYKISSYFCHVWNAGWWWLICKPTQTGNIFKPLIVLYFTSPGIY